MRERRVGIDNLTDETTDNDRLIDVQEAARLLNVKVSTVYQWKYERRIPWVKLFNRAVRFRLSAIRKLIEESEHPALR
jgi:excisionase family DNA binding protein